MRNPRIGTNYDWEDVKTGEYVYWDDDTPLELCLILENDLEANCFISRGLTIWRKEQVPPRWTMLRLKA